MDQRVIDLWDRLMAYGESGSAPLPAIRDEVLELHAAITDEAQSARSCDFGQVEERTLNA